MFTNPRSPFVGRGPVFLTVGEHNRHVCALKLVAELFKTKFAGVNTFNIVLHYFVTGIKSLCIFLGVPPI